MKKKEIQEETQKRPEETQKETDRSDMQKGNERKRKEAKANCFISLICPFNG